MRPLTLAGLVSLFLITACMTPAVPGGNASPKPGPSSSTMPGMALRQAFSKIHVADAAQADSKAIVVRTEAELAAALKDRGLDKFPDSQETIAKALKAVDFSKETAILIDQGLVPSMTQTVEPIDAIETAQSITVRYRTRQSEIDLPALNRPYAILAIPKTDKPVTVTLVN
jgi:hypothetical protein